MSSMKNKVGRIDHQVQDIRSERTIYVKHEALAGIASAHFDKPPPNVTTYRWRELIIGEIVDVVDVNAKTCASDPRFLW